jgi:CRISPR system Cascade subunit CasE
MILSRITVDWRNAANPYDIHCALWRLFPGQPKEARENFAATRAGFLFCIEALAVGRGAMVLMQSATPPVPEAEGARVLRLSNPFDPVLQTGQRLGFLLTANAVKTIADESGRLNDKGEIKKCRVPLLREEERRTWLARKLDGAAELENVELRTDRPLYFRKQGVGKIAPVTFEGVLRVTDGVKLVHHLTNGIGPAKAFGCGLMLVRRL